MVVGLDGWASHSEDFDLRLVSADPVCLWLLTGAVIPGGFVGVYSNCGSLAGVLAFGTILDNMADCFLDPYPVILGRYHCCRLVDPAM